MNDGVVTYKVKLSLQEAVDLEIVSTKMRLDILNHVKKVVEENEDISKLSKILVMSNTYLEVQEKYQKEEIFKKVKFHSYFLKIAGDVVNQVMFYNSI